MARPSGQSNSSFLMELPSKTFCVQEQGPSIQSVGKFQGIIREEMRPRCQTGPTCWTQIGILSWILNVSEKLDICFSPGSVPPKLQGNRPLVRRPCSFIFKLLYAKRADIYLPSPEIWFLISLFQRTSPVRRRGLIPISCELRRKVRSPSAVVWLAGVREKPRRYWRRIV